MATQLSNRSNHQTSLIKQNISINNKHDDDNEKTGDKIDYFGTIGKDLTNNICSYLPTSDRLQMMTVSKNFGSDCMLLPISRQVLLDPIKFNKLKSNHNKDTIIYLNKFMVNEKIFKKIYTIVLHHKVEGNIFYDISKSGSIKISDDNRESDIHKNMKLYGSIFENKGIIISCIVDPDNKLISHVFAPHCKFIKLQLDSSNIINCYLENGTWSDCDLFKSNFAGSDIWKSTFKQSDLTNSKIENCNLSSAGFVHCKLIKSKFYNTKLTSTKFSNCNMTNFVMDDNKDREDNVHQGVRFNEVCLLNATFTLINFNDTIFCSVQLTDSKFVSCELVTCRFIDGSNLRKIKFTKSRLIMDSFPKTDLTDSIFLHCTLTDVDFSQANLTNSVFSYCTLTDVDFSQANLTNSVFLGCTLTNIDFSQANLSDAKFNKCVVSNINSTDAIGYNPPSSD